MPPVFIHAMPAINPGGSGSAGPQQRTTFRPPWVKDGPEPLPMPTAPWTLARTRDQKNDGGSSGAAGKPSSVRLRAASIENDGSSTSAAGGKGAAGRAEVEKEKSPKAEPGPVRKQSKITIVPTMPKSPAAKENGHQSAGAGVRAEAKPKDEPPTTTATLKRKPSQERRNRSVDQEPRAKDQQSTDSAGSAPSAAIPVEVKSVKTPAAPPMPPPPPPQAGKKVSAPVTAAKAEKLEMLKSRPRKRPDWGTLMKDIESGRKLKHVQCNDRSSPLLPKVKVKEGFMYESEKANVHNQLLKEIQSGVSLKRVQTNDRSKPLLEGLRKFRRQLTIEEQIQKATEAEVVEAEPDELDDIDKVRDDLQSTKQMLALELRNKEAVERENKRLQAKILDLEAELEREKASSKQANKTPEVINKKHEEDIKALKSTMQEQEKHAKEMENLYHDVVGQLDLTKNELEAALKKNKILENKMTSQAKDQDYHALTKQPSSKKIPQNKEVEANNVGQNNDLEVESEYEEVTETEEESEESSEDSDTDKAALQEKRTARELKLLMTKLKALKEKESTSRRERRSLRDQLKKQQKALREEKKKYKELQKEVDKMASLMKDEEEEEAENKSETEEESESESESESEESEEEESEGDVSPDAPVEDKRKNLTERAKRHENSLTVVKKGNYMLKANIDRLKDELFKQKEMSLTLQEDLNSVLAELG